MMISDGWIRYESPSLSVQNDTIVLASDNDSAGTIEEIRWHPQTGRVYRKRWWSTSRAMSKGEVWFSRDDEET